MRIGNVDDDQVRALSWLEGSDLFIEMNRAGAADRRHLQSFASVDHRRVFRSELVKLRGGIDLFPKIQIIVRSRAIGSESNGHARLEHRRHRSGSSSQFHVRLRAMPDADATSCKR